jgi:hypothetical protein
MRRCPRWRRTSIPFSVLAVLLALVVQLLPAASAEPPVAIRPCCVRLPWDGALSDFVLDLRYTVTTDSAGRVSSIGSVKSRSNIDLLDAWSVSDCVRGWSLPPAGTFEVRIGGKSYEPVTYDVWRGRSRLAHVESPQLCPGPLPRACTHPAGIMTAVVGLHTVATEPRVLSKVPADCSHLARPCPSGIVIFEAGIDRAGAVRSTCVVRGLREDADEAAAAALRQWKWEPSRLRSTGEPIALVLTVTVSVGEKR